MKSTSRIVKEALRESRFPLMAGVSSGMVDVVKRAMHVVAHEVQAQEAVRYENLKQQLAAIESYARGIISEIEASATTPMPVVEAGRKSVARAVLDIIEDKR